MMSSHSGLTSPDSQAKPALRRFQSRFACKFDAGKVVDYHIGGRL